VRFFLAPSFGSSRFASGCDALPVDPASLSLLGGAAPR
jgi:hypothetical protein